MSNDPAALTKSAASGSVDDADVCLIAFLQDRDILCPACGYNLRGLIEPRCPECGRELRLTVGLTEPILRAWIALAVGIFGSAGIGALFWMLQIVEGPPRLMRGGALAAFSYFMFSPVLIWPTLALRRRFLRLDSGRQWSIAISAIILMIAFAVAFVAGVN